jgi:hypothetical protein
MDKPQTSVAGSENAILSAHGDPILTAIASYRAEVARYNVLSADHLSSEQSDALADETFVPPLCALEKWPKPALTRAGAITALQLALEEARENASWDIVASMVAASLAYLKSGGAA